MHRTGSLVVVFVAVLAAAAVGQAKDFGNPMQFPTGVSTTSETSLIALLGHPEKWEGRAVSVLGYISPDLHGVLVFSSSEFCLARADQYSILVDLGSMKPTLQWSQLPAEHCVRAEVEGYFHEFKREAPKPDTYVLRDRPGYVEAQFIAYR